MQEVFQAGITYGLITGFSSFIVSLGIGHALRYFYSII